MIDTINPMSLDLTKNLHGHVRVELRDRWTGRVVDSQEKDNLVTNAVQRAIQTVQFTSNAEAYMSAAWTPIYNKALGGIFLFNDTLTESASNIDFPSSAKLVAYAGQSSDASNVRGGSYNEAESVFTSNGFTTVWDFLTSQANGTISSLARTSHYFLTRPAYPNWAGMSLTAGANSSLTMTNNFNWLGYDETNHYLYLAPGSTQTINGVTYASTNIYRIKYDLSKLSLLNCMPPASQMTLIKTLTSSDGTTAAINYAYDKFNNNFVYINGTTIHKIAMDGTHTTSSATGTSGDGFAITENYYWRSTGSVVYRIQKSNTANIESFTVDYCDRLRPAGESGDAVFCSTLRNQNWSILYPDGFTVPWVGFDTGAGQYAWMQNFRKIGFYYAAGNYSTGTFITPSSHYLGTIANLDSPVTKTSSQTMKITYTLTEA